MSEFKVIKNGLCLTLDADSSCGYYNLILKGNKIFDIDYNNELNSDREIFKKFPDVEIVDAANKIIVPAFLNSHKNSSYSLSSVFLKENSYDNINSNIAIRLIDKHFSNTENLDDLISLFNMSYIKSFLNGEIFVNETSKYIGAEIIRSNTFAVLSFKPEIIFTVYDSYISDYCLGINKFHCVGLREEEDLNNYTLSSLKKALQRGNKRAIIEILQTANSADLLRGLFGKSFIRVLADNDLLNSSIIFSNPIFIANDEINMLVDKKVNLILCPSDAFKFTRKGGEFDRFVSKPVNISIGTGIQGKSVFTELKLLRLVLKGDSISSELFLRMITTNPALLFGLYNITSTIEKNKLGNFIMFDLSDVRNFLDITEIDSEKVCDFILDNLDEKDISDIVFKGNFVLKNYRNEKLDFVKINETNCRLVKKINEVGRYFEFKEKHKMRERVRELSLGGTTSPQETESRNPEPYIYSERQFEGEGEFRIIGAKKIEYPEMENDGHNVANDDSEWIDEISSSVRKIEDFNSGISVFEATDFDYEKINPQDIKATSKDYSSDLMNKVKAPTKKLFFDDSGGASSLKKVDISNKIVPVTTKPVFETKKQNEKVVFKKTKLRFGFEDTSSKND